MLLLLIALAGPPEYNVFAECDYGRVMASSSCEQREQVARFDLEQTWDGYHAAKKSWCVQQIVQRIQIYRYMWLKHCLEQDDERPVLPHRLAPFWGRQPNE